MRQGLADEEAFILEPKGADRLYTAVLGWLRFINPFTIPSAPTPPRASNLQGTLHWCYIGEPGSVFFLSPADLDWNFRLNITCRHLETMFFSPFPAIVRN